MVLMSNIHCKNGILEADAYNDINDIKAHVMAKLDGSYINYTMDSDIVKATWNIVVDYKDYISKGKKYPNEIPVAWG